MELCTVVPEFFTVNKITETPHLEKLHMYFPSWRLPLPSVVPQLNLIHGLPYPNVHAFPVLLSALKMSETNTRKKWQELFNKNWYLSCFVQNKCSEGFAAVNVSHSGLCLVSITPAFCPTRKYKIQRQKKNPPLASDPHPRDWTPGYGTADWNEHPAEGAC